MRLPTLLAVAVLLVAAGGCGAAGDADGALDPAAEQSDAPQEPGTAAPADGSDGSDGSAAADLPFLSGDGWFEVDGVRHEARWVARCLPEEIGPQPIGAEEVNLIAYAGDQGVFELRLSTREVVLAPDDERNYTAEYVHPALSRTGASGLEQFGDVGLATGPDGAWYDLQGSDPFQLALGNQGEGPVAGSAASRGGGRVSGSLDLEQTWPEEVTGQVSVTYDLSIPSEEFDCDEL